MQASERLDALRTPSSLVASLVYLLSAAVMLLGIGKVLEPIWAQQEIAAEKFACVGALHGYELALLAAALVIVLWKQVVEDAVALVLLFAAFLVGAAASLDVVAPDYAGIATGIGAAALAAAGVKLWALQRWLVRPLGRGLWASLLLLLASNFLLPGALGLVMSGGGGRAAFEMVDPWLVGWWVSLLSAGMLLLVAVRLAPTALTLTADPLLRRPIMRWHVAGVVLGGTFLHQAALIWAFNLPLSLVVLHPAIGVLAFYATAIQRAQGRTDAESELGFLGLALAALLLVTASGRFAITSGTGLGLISYPPVYAGVMAAACAGLAWYWRRPRLWWMAALYILAAVLTAGVDPQAATPPAWNWTACGAAALLGLAFLALWHRSVALAAAVLAGLAAMLALRHDLLEPWLATLHVHAVVLGLLILGTGWLVLFTLAHRHVPRWLIVVAAVIFSASVTLAVAQSGWVWGWQVATVGVLAVTLAAAWRVRQFAVAVVGAVPVLVVLARQAGPLIEAASDVVNERPGWALVGLSFILLGLGTLISLTKQHWLRWLPMGRQPASPPPEEQPGEPV